MLMVIDALVAVVVAVMTFELRFRMFPGEPAPDMFDPAWPPLVLYAATWVALLYLGGQYRLRAHWSLRSQMAGIARATVWLALLTLASLYVTRLSEVSRAVILILFPLQWAATVVTRYAIQVVFRFVRRQGRNRRFILIVGTTAPAIAFARVIEAQPALGLEVVGMLGDEPPSEDAHWAYLGPISGFGQVLRERIVDEVAICLPASMSTQIEAVSQMSQGEGKIVRIPLDIPQIDQGRSFIEDLDGTAVLTLLRLPEQTLALFAKRIMDVLGSVAGLIILSPLLIIVACVILVRDGPPFIFTQERIGKNGRRFRIYKFRTMTRDAEMKYAEIQHLSATRGAAFKMVDDPRVMTWGRWMRRFSVDELPQLWNVLRGDMSLVGPRPAPPREVDVYDPWHRRRLSMKPGMTGLWQVSSRLDVDFDDRAAIDLDYIDRWSLRLDLGIIARTIPVVLRSLGH